MLRCWHQTGNSPHEGLVKATKPTKGWSNNITVHIYCNCTAAKKKKQLFLKKMDGLCHVYGDSLQKVEIGIALLDVKGIFMAQSYPTQYVLYNIWVT